jgi:hypothetical protein
MALAEAILKTADNPIVEAIGSELMPSAVRIQWLSLDYRPQNYKKVAGLLGKAYKSIKNKDPQGAAKAFADFAVMHIEAANLRIDKEGLGQTDSA